MEFSITIPVWVQLCILPWALMFAVSFTFDSTPSGGYFCPGWSDRSMFIGFASVACAFTSAMIAWVYWMGVARGWW